MYKTWITKNKTYRIEGRNALVIAKVQRTHCLKQCSETVTPVIVKEEMQVLEVFKLLRAENVNKILELIEAKHPLFVLNDHGKYYYTILEEVTIIPKSKDLRCSSCKYMASTECPYWKSRNNALTNEKEVMTCATFNTKSDFSEIVECCNYEYYED